jgi:FG-GAP-like repeat/FG-GAP repeat
VSNVPHRRTSTSFLGALIACLLWAAPAQAAFVSALDSPVSTGVTTRALAAVDADRNGTVDVAAGGLTIWRNDGTGRMRFPTAIGGPGPVEGLASGDLNGDGTQDFAAIAPGSAGSPRRVLTYTAVPGTASYIQATALEDAGDDATDLAIANLNGDGLADIVVTSEAAGSNVTVLLNQVGGFLDATYTSDLPAPSDIAVTDFTGDGMPDVAVAGGSGSVSLLVNEGGGTFADGERRPTGAAGSVGRLTATHVDADGLADLVATDAGATPAALVLRGNGAGGFVPLGPQPLGLPFAPISIATGDINGDGATDVVAGSGGGQFAVLHGNGQGGVSPAPGSPFRTDDPAGGDVTDLAAVDLNRDSQLDVATANRPGSVSVMLNSDTGLLAPSPATADFGVRAGRTAPSTRVVTLRGNRGRVRITRLERQGTSAFSIRDNGCVGATLLLGQSCSLTVTFTPPRRARRYEGLLSVDANAAAVIVPLTGTVRPPAVLEPRLRPKRVKAGGRMNLRYQLSEPARLRARFERALPGRRAGKLCVAPTRRYLERRRCTAWQRVSTVSSRDEAGANLLRLRARANGKPLAPGRYRLEITAADRFRNRSEERFAKFTVTPRKRVAPRRRSGRS